MTVLVTCSVSQRTSNVVFEIGFECAFRVLFQARVVSTIKGVVFSTKYHLFRSVHYTCSIRASNCSSLILLNKDKQQITISISVLLLDI